MKSSAPRSLPSNFDAIHLVTLVDTLDTEAGLNDASVSAVVRAKTAADIEGYREFLVSGDIVEVRRGSWRPTSKGAALANALRRLDIPEVLETLRNIPSFDAFADHVGKYSAGETTPPGAFVRAFQAYRILGEVTRLCACIHGEGVYATPNVPKAEEFASIAVTHFNALDDGYGLVSTAEWLKRLVRFAGVHPEVARARLDETSRAGYLHRSTEGSTTDLRNGRHILHVLRSNSGRPGIERVHLYRGDYLIPDKASTSLRIKEKDFRFNIM